MGTVDLIVLVAYLVTIVGVGAAFARRSRTADDFVAAGGTLPGWALGLALFGGYVSSISFLANPGKAYASDWAALAYTFAMPVAAAAATAWVVPFYRARGEVSAYHHLEHRFGPWARTYAVVCYLLTQLARTGTVVYLLALAVAPLTGWPVVGVIVGTGLAMTVYTMLGGIRAVVWTGAVQSLVLLAGPIVCLAVLLMTVPGGPAGVVRDGLAAGKFSLGGFGADLSRPTFWVVFAYGLVMNFAGMATDQGAVQRYVAARSRRDAAKSLWLGAVLYVPTATLFFLVGTSLFAFYAAHPERLAGGAAAAAKADAVFPHFIATELPAGLGGLVVAAIFAASMDSSLNSMATLTLYDVYRRYVRPAAGEREDLRVLYAATAGWGVVATAVAVAMARGAAGALDVWWQLAGLFAGGVLGLFVLGRIARRATGRDAAIAVAAGVVALVWVAGSNKAWWPAALAWARSPFHELLGPVVGTGLLLATGVTLSRFRRRPAAEPVIVVDPPAAAPAPLA